MCWNFTVLCIKIANVYTSCFWSYRLPQAAGMPTCITKDSVRFSGINHSDVEGQGKPICFIPDIAQYAGNHFWTSLQSVSMWLTFKNYLSLLIVSLCANVFVRTNSHWVGDMWSSVSEFSSCSVFFSLFAYFPVVACLIIRGILGCWALFGDKKIIFVIVIIIVVYCFIIMLIYVNCIMLVLIY